MRKMIMLVGCLCAAAGCLPGLATAGPVPVEGQFTVPAASTAFTNPVALTAASYDIDRIVLYNAGAVTCAVTVAASDIGVLTTLDTFALAAAGGASQYPPGRALVSYETVNLVTGNVFVVKQNVETNWVPISTRDVTITVNKPTNATDCVVYYRIYGRTPGR